MQPILPVSADSASFPRGVVYTSQNPGKWSKKVGGHLPNVNVEGNKVTVTTTHGMTDEQYIVRHTLVSGNGDVLGEKTFSPSDAEAKSVFELSGTHSKYVWDTATPALLDHRHDKLPVLFEGLVGVPDSPTILLDRRHDDLFVFFEGFVGVLESIAVTLDRL